MGVHSILFLRPEQRAAAEDAEAPDCFRDLHLDQVVEAVTAGRSEYRLQGFFHTPLPDLKSIAYRHEVFRDLESAALEAVVRTFADRIRAVRGQLAQAAKLRYPLQQERWFLEAVATYLDAVGDLCRALGGLDLRSRGFLSLRGYLAGYARSPGFTALAAETARLRQALAGVTYTLHIQGNRIRVARYAGEGDYAADVEATFQRFRQGPTKDYRVDIRDWPEMNHVEAAVLERVALLHPEVFGALHRYCEGHRDFLDRVVADFDREVQFYLAYLEHCRRFSTVGLSFCYPHVSDRSKAIAARDTFDLALADRLIREGRPVVCNDFALRDPERIMVVTGPNQGGKTTFARTVGQLHYLAGLGCPVPGTAARLFLCDRLFTHFEREERVENLRGKLQDDLLRLREILSRATPRSLVIVNEAFTSTSLRDARFLGRRVLERLLALGLLGVWVTFVDELAALGDQTVSMVSTVDPANPTRRMFKIVRRPADGRAYAAAIAEQYGLSYERLKERLAR